MMSGWKSIRSDSSSNSRKKTPAEAVGRRPDVGPSDVAGCAIQKILEPWRRYQVVKYLHCSYPVGIPKWRLLFPRENDFANLIGVMMSDQTISAKTLDARNSELGQCVKTDGVQSGRCSQAIRAYAIAQLGRISDFMQRHTLMSQFYQEDDQGKR